MLADGSDMARELTLGGFRMTTQEWLDMDEAARLMYIRIVIETSPPRADDWVYETYELSLEARAS